MNDASSTSTSLRQRWARDILRSHVLPLLVSSQSPFTHAHARILSSLADMAGSLIRRIGNDATALALNADRSVNAVDVAEVIKSLGLWRGLADVALLEGDDRHDAVVVFEAFKGRSFFCRCRRLNFRGLQIFWKRIAVEERRRRRRRTR